MYSPFKIRNKTSRNALFPIFEGIWGHDLGCSKKDKTAFDFDILAKESEYGVKKPTQHPYKTANQLVTNEAACGAAKHVRNIHQAADPKNTPSPLVGEGWGEGLNHHSTNRRCVW